MALALLPGIWGCTQDSGSAGGETAGDLVGETAQALSGGVLSTGTATLVSPEVRCDRDSARYAVTSQPTTSYCREVKIHCNSLTNGSDTDTGDDIIVQLAVRTPPSPNGVALFHSGNNGATWPDPGYAADAYLHGLRTVKLRWRNGTGGWQDGTSSAYDGKGLRANACRPATAFKYVYDTFGPGTPGMPTSAAFCGHGKSGGAGAIAYAMAAYGQESIFDYVQLVSGPPYMRLEMGCTGIRPSDSLGQVPFDSCPAFFAPGTSEEVPVSPLVYMFQGAGPQANIDKYHGTAGTYGCGIMTRPSPDPNFDVWSANNVLNIYHPTDPGYDSDFDFPQTKVDVNICKSNGDATYWQGNMFYKAVITRSTGPSAVHCWGDTSATAHSPGQNFDDCDTETYTAGAINGHVVTGNALTDQFAQMAAGCVRRHGG